MDGLCDSKRSLGSMSVGQHPESAAGAPRLSYKRRIKGSIAGLLGLWCNAVDESKDGS